MKCWANRKSIAYFFLLVLVCISGSALSQDSIKTFETKFIMGGGEPELLEEAEWFMGIQDYKRALPIYIKLYRRYPGVPEYAFLTGMCYLNMPDQQENAIPYIEEAYKQKPSMRDMEYALGKAYFVNYRFDEAVNHLKLALESKKTSGIFIDEIPRLITHCKNGIEIMAEYDERWYKLTNIGAPINTEFEEYVPLVAFDASSMIYTYRGKRSTGGMRNTYGELDPEGMYFEDIFTSNRLGDKWLEPDEIGGLLNSNWHDAAIAVSPDGQRLFVYKDLKGGDIYVSKLKRRRWGSPVQLEGDINSKYWEGHASISVDGNTIYFSSDRPGGLGGRDIYKATLKDYDEWGDVENLGSKINTEFDDDSPFIHANGELLYFSSKGHNSMGGYDVFFSKSDNDKWQKPINIGHPVNTPNDDLYYMVTPSGEKAYFSSARQGGKGGQDLYEVVPGILGEKPALTVVKGMLTYNGRNTDAEIKVANMTSNESYGSYNSNETSGNYLIALPQGSAYKLEYMVKGNVVKTELVNLTDLADYVEVVEDFELSSKRNSDIDRTDILQEKINGRIMEIAAMEPDLIEEIAMVEPDPELVSEPEPNNSPEEEPEEVIVTEEITEKKKIVTDRVPEEQETTDTVVKPREVSPPDTAEPEELPGEPEPLKPESEYDWALVTVEQPKPETTTELEPETEPAVEPEPLEPIEVVAEPEVEPEPEVEVETEPAVEPEPLEPIGVVAEPEVEPEPEVEAEAEPAVEPEPLEPIEVVAEPEPEPEPKKQEMEEVLFGFDKSTVPTGYNKVLDKLFELMKANKSLKAEVNGHTDHIGPAEYNDKLSLRRANAVADYLKSKGISADRLIINGFGESRPISPNIRPDGTDNPTGRKKNRRTEIRLIDSPMLGDPPQV